MNSFVRIGALAGALGVTLLTSYAATSRRSLQDHDVVIDKELLITSVAVVDSPLASYPGPWSFGHLFEEAYGEENAARMAARWLEDWAVGQPSERGRVAIKGREGVRKLLIEPWQKADGYVPRKGEGGEEDGWRPNFENAPFQLLAIANRMDLSVSLASFKEPGSIPLPAGRAYYGSPGGFDSSGGEGRLIFAITDQEGVPLEPGVTLIFEYGLDIARQHDRFLDWAMAWHELGTHESHDATYRASLAKVTRAFTDHREVNDPGQRSKAPKTEEIRKMSLIDRLTHTPANMPTQLMRIRSNDGGFGKVREFREFQWTAKGFDPAPLAGTPREIFFQRGTVENRWMARWLRVQGTEKPIVTIARDDPASAIPNNFVLPATVRVRSKLVPIVAHVAPVPANNAAYHWDGWGTRRHDLRRAFSMQTCCGCHCGDTNTEFFHIAPRLSGEETELSKFLRTDGTRWRPIDPNTKRSYLSAEMDLRKKIFEAALHPEVKRSKIKALKASRQGAAH